MSQTTPPADMRTDKTPKGGTAQVIIETQRLTLRPLRASDAGLMEMATRDLRVAGATASIPHPLPPGGTQAFIAACNRTDRSAETWAFDGSKSGLQEICGCISLDRLEGKEDAPSTQSEVGYWVSPAVWNMGLATEGLAALLAVNPLQSDVVSCSVFQDNPASARVLSHCAFTYLGDAESYSVARRATVPTWTYSKRLAA